MKGSRAQKRAKLTKAAQEIIDELLDWGEKTAAPDLTQIEDEVLKLRQRFGERMVAVVTEGQEGIQPAKAPVCEKCKEPMRYKGRKKIGVESRVASLVLKRGHYYCARCESGIFPPGRAVEVGGEELERRVGA